MVLSLIFLRLRALYSRSVSDLLKHWANLWRAHTSSPLIAEPSEISYHPTEPIHGCFYKFRRPFLGCPCNKSPAI